MEGQGLFGGKIQARLQKLMSGDVKALTDVSGKLTKSNGEPIAYAGVFLRRQDDINHSITDFEPYQTMTNEKGEYSFRGVLPGSYKLFLGLDVNQISGWTWPTISDDGWIDLRGQNKLEENVVFQPLMELKTPVNEEVVRDKKLTFEWKPVEGAAYYNLNIGLKFTSGSASRQIKQGIVTSRVQIPAEDLYDEISGISSFASGQEEMKVDPLSLLGYANTDNQFSWSVEAYNADGELLTRSDGYRLGNDLTGQLPFFYLKERSMTDADKTLLTGDLEKAEAMYKADVQHNPADAHSLHMMHMLLEGKIMLLRGEGAKVSGEKASLMAKQAELLKKLVELHPTADYYDWLADYYLKETDWKEYNRYYALAESMRQTKDNSYSDATHAVALMRQGKMDEATAYFQQSLDHDKSHRFIGSYLAVTLYLGGSMDQAISLAGKYPDRMMYNTSLNWEELIHEMKRESTGNRGYNAALQSKIELYVQGKEKELKQWQPAAGSGLTAMKKFMDALGQVR
ncbi:MAG: carboxypeptidase regulatory-like domain-containing protein [Paenibacillus sp.]|nr:carboxypeptidase regulatory-like domain-containing protein [Paenibacillus sp.]